MIEWVTSSSRWVMPRSPSSPQRRREALGEVGVAQQAEGERSVGTHELLDGRHRVADAHLVPSQLAAERVECGIRLSPRLHGEVRRPVGENLRTVERGADALVAIEYGGREVMERILRAEPGWQEVVAVRSRRSPDPSASTTDSLPATR